MVFRTLGRIGISVAAMVLMAGLARSQSGSSKPAESANPAGDDLQRSARIYNYTQVATSGPQRGEVIYFYKCWMCHNKYTKSAPYLSDVFKRPKLVSGNPVSEDTIREQIKNGSARMPAFRYTLTDADVSDLLSYLRGGKCCYEEEDPPLNPWYHKP